MRKLIGLTALVIALTSIPTSLYSDIHPTSITDRAPRPRGRPLAAPSLTGWNIDVVDLIESGRCRLPTKAVD